MEKPDISIWVLQYDVRVWALCQTPTGSPQRDSGDLDEVASHMADRLVWRQPGGWPGGCLGCFVVASLFGDFDAGEDAAEIVHRELFA